MAFNRQENSIGGSEPIALIGVGCKLPGGITTTEGLLEALREGRDLISEVPPDRWNVDAFYDADSLVPGKTYVRKGGFVDNIYQFDAGFFGISDSEASRMDPQQRMVLQAVWHALEDAGQSADELMNSNTGVFLGMMNTNGYSHLKGVFEGPRGINAYDAMGDAMSITAGRISHFLGLEGPCMTLDTACSSSLVALHLARQSILSGECDMAIVAGVNAIMHPAVHIAFSKMGLMSRAGRCATFDVSADGYVRGEGCVAVILRRESVAVERGDRILASIVGTAVNQDGRTPALTAPNGRSQEKVIRSALARIGVSPNEIKYVEAHGTGTPIGDPIEMSAIVNVYGPGRSDDQTLYVGSVKSNFGHIEAGAGLLGLVKVALSLTHEEILPSIHFTKLNPGIDLSRAPVKVPTQITPWPRTDKPRLAGLNSFGYSGTNAHVIIQEAPASNSRPASPSAAQRGLIEGENRMVLISAKSNAALDDLVDKWIEFLNKETTLPIGNVAFTSALGRTHLSHRLAITGKDNEEIKQKLQNWREGRTPKGFASGQMLFKIKPRVAFVFTGQGAQYAEMGRELYQTEPRFAESIDKVAEVMDADLGVPLTEVLFGEKSAEYLENTRYVQPALFAIEFALAELLRWWGVEPSYVIGHSVGELVAACVAGVLDMDDAARFVVARGRLMGALPEGGKMLAISASVDQVQKWIIGREAEVAIATVNGPRAVVVSGSAEAIAAIDEIAQGAGRQTKELEVSHAFHSPLMDPILNELTEVAKSMRAHTPRIPIASNTTGDFYKDEPKPEYWSQHVRQAVLFHAGMEKIIDAGCTMVIEVGPHPALTPAVVTAFDSPSLQTVPTLRRDKKDVANLLGTLSTLFVNGAPLKFERLLLDTNYHTVALPLYPFRPDKYSLTLEGVIDLPPESFPLMEHAGATVADDEPELPDLPVPLHPLLGQSISRTARKAVFEVGLKTASPWTDHRVLESTVFPGTGYLEMASRGYAAMQGLDSCPVILKEVAFERPLLLSFREEKKVRLTLEQPSNSKASAKFTISTADDSNTIYCRGRINTYVQTQGPVILDEEFAGRQTEVKIGSFYGELRTRGLEYGARFANVRELWQGKEGSGEAIGRVTDTSIAAQNMNDPYKNAILLDGCLHVFGAALNMLDEINNQAGAFVPASIQSITINGNLPAQVWSHVRVSTSGDKRAALANVRVLSDAGDLLVEFNNLELRHTMSMSVGKKVSTGQSTANKFFKSRENLIEILRPMTRKERVSLLSKWMTAEIVDTMGQAAAGLNLEKLPPSTAFLEIGLDSLLVTELQRRIQERLEFRFKPMQGLDYQSIESLASYIHDEVLAADLADAPVAETSTEQEVSEAAAD